MKGTFLQHASRHIPLLPNQECPKIRHSQFFHTFLFRNPTYYVPDLQHSITEAYIFNHNGLQLMLANGGHPLLTKAHVYQLLEKK